jgi:hypothetical protein
MNTTPWYAAAAAIVILGAAGIAGGAGGNRTDAAACRRRTTPAETGATWHDGGPAAPWPLRHHRLGQLAQRGDPAKANAIDAACAAVDTHNETGRWPTGYAP